VEEAKDVITDTVQGVLEVHKPSALGMCAGCMQTWWRLVPFPCSQSEWAVRLAEQLASEGKKR